MRTGWLGIIACASVLASSGCSTTFKKLPKTQARISEAARQEAQATRMAVDRVRQDVSAALALSPSNAPLASADGSSGLAYRLAGRTEALVGAPANYQAARVDALLSTNAAGRALAVEQERDRDALMAVDMEAKRDQETILIEKGRLYEMEQNKSIVRRLWTWATRTVGLGGLIAICFLFPAVIPVVGRGIGWLIARIPQLSNMIGMVGVKSYERAVTAIQEIKQAAKLSGQSAAEDLARKVAAENTGKDAALVAHIKDKLDYPKSGSWTR
jgi:hypothetical protein